ncbi:MAG: RNB domain-containing ribonuclease [Bryobacteraceae bacterium]
MFISRPRCADVARRALDRALLVKPQEDRLVLSAILEIDNRGDVVSQRFTSGLIRSVERMTYTNVHLLLEGDRAQRERYAPLLERFELMQELANKLNRKRVKRGSIDFDMPEALIEFDSQGDMMGVARAPRNVAHRLIEEFMLAANEAVASHLEQAEIPSIYRIHEPPDGKRLLDFEEIAATFGYSLGIGAIPVKKFKNTEKGRDGRKVTKEIVLPEDAKISSKAYQRLVARLEGKPEERILTYLMLRSLKQARYSNENKGHFALAAESYTHFTSPIRRYPDLLLHRIFSDYMQTQTSSIPEDKIQAIAADCSMTERRADEAERELVEWKKAKFMEDRVGEQFNALVISVTRFGLFVELAEYFIEGLVPIDLLPGDSYRFQENVRKIIGLRSRRQFSIGDRVDVVLDRVDSLERKLTFSIVEERVQRKRKR